MATISLVLPFALPVPEFAPDLIRVLQAPALASLLSRSAECRFQALAPAARALPHELWIAQALGLARGPAQSLEPAVATAAMRGFGLDPEGGTWFIVNPAHIQIASTHLMMGDPRQLGLQDAEGRALFDSAREDFLAGGYELVYGSADTWFMRADDWNDMHTASLEAAVGMNLTDWMPTGPQARAFRKLQNEVQVNWYAHAVNAAREARGLSAVNAIWPWGGASMATEQAGRLVAGARGTLGARPGLHTHAVPGWLDALGSSRAATPGDLLDGLADAGDTPLLLVAGNAATPAIAADWDGWLRAMQLLDETLCAPLLEAVRRGGVKRLRMVLSHRDGHLETVTTPMTQRKFWRRPTLDALT